MKKYDLICCSTDNWDDIWRRRQHLCNKLSKKKWIGKILFVEPAFSIFSALKELNLKRFKNARKMKKINAKIYIFKPIWPLPFVRFNIIRKLNFNIYLNQVKKQIKKLNFRNIIAWFSHPSFESIVGKFGEKLIWYDCTDDWSMMPAITKNTARVFKRQHVMMIEKANIVTAVSQYLVDKAKKINRNSYLVPNGVNFDFYNNQLKKTNNVPNDIKNIPKPILGYVGSIWADRLDFDLVNYIAEKKRSWSLVFIGPITIKSGLNNITKCENVYFLGRKSYQELPKYIANFDICIIPHKRNELTESMNPIKLFEYLATGKPVVTTDIAGVRNFRNLFKVARNNEEFNQFVEGSLNEDNDSLREKRLKAAKENTWQKRVEEIEKVLNETINNHS